MKTLLLTGATGFVGRNLLLRAVAEGWHVMAPVRDSAKLSRQLAVEGVSGSSVTPLSCDPSTWRDIKPSLAVLSAGVLFARNREEYFETNVEWTRWMVAALPPSCRIIALSSQSAGGPTPPGAEARSESMQDEPITWYGESKRELEKALVRDFAGREITILRPPMILGARDSATLPLFKMARGFLRTKPGLKTKSFSFVAVDDVVAAIFAAIPAAGIGPYYISSRQLITDLQLIETAARVMDSEGITLAIPQPLIRLLSAVVDATPPLRRAVPSLTRDRAREIWADRWVVDPTLFEQTTGWTASIDLEAALRSAFLDYQKTGQL